MISRCVYCDRDVKSDRTEGHTLRWRAIQDGKLTCDLRPYTLMPGLHAIQHERGDHA